jgi:hypothetical protein
METVMRRGEGGPLLKSISVMVLCALMACLAACSDKVKWKEDVKLNDGRIITVIQERRCDGGDFRADTDATCVARESWLTISLPEISKNDIIWHEKLDPLIVNIDNGSLYVIGMPPHPSEFRAYGAKNPPYIGFRWANNTWNRISFEDIPATIYETNMLIESIPRTQTKHLTLANKNSKGENGNPAYPSEFRRLDPNATMPKY